LPKYAPVIPDVANGAIQVVGIVTTIIGRLRATKPVTFTPPQQ